MRKLVLLPLILLLCSFVPNASKSKEVIDISSSNVSIDLKVFYGGENWQSFDINTLMPDASNAIDLDFKLLLVKPVNRDLYLYTFTRSATSTDSLTARISMSKTQNADGSWTEEFNNYNGTIVNRYGYLTQFSKFVIYDVVDLVDDNRFNIDSINVKYDSGLVSGSKLVNHETYFRYGDNNDFIYDYFKDDYVIISDGKVTNFLIPETTKTLQNGGIRTIYEHFYYFFDTNKNIDELIEVTYDYQLLNYTAVKERGPFSNMPKLNGAMNYVYTGSHGEILPDVVGYNTISVKTYNNVMMPSEKRINNQQQSFLWWKWGVKYEYDTIVDVQNTTSIQDTVFKTFIEDVGSKNTGGRFQWAFQVHESERKFVKGWQPNLFTYRYMSDCNEVKQTMITRLKFRTGTQEFDLNAIDQPKDTSETYINTLPFPTFGEAIIKSVVSLGGNLADTLNSVWESIMSIVYVILVLLVFVIIYKLLRWFRG